MAATTSVLAVGTAEGNVSFLSVFKDRIEASKTLQVGDKPMFLAASPKEQTVLFSVYCDAAIPAGVAVIVDKQRVASVAPGPCHVAVDEDGSLVCVVCYETGHVTLLEFDLSRAELHVCDQLQLGDGTYTGNGRQDGSHPHQAVFHRTTTKSLLFVTDLGLDAVHVFHVVSKELRLVDTCQLPTGSGPRHLVVDEHNTAFVLHELDNRLAVITFDEGENTLKLLKVYDEVVPTSHQEPPFDFYTAPSHAAEIVFHPSTQHIICTNRGHDSLSVFAKNGNSLTHKTYFVTTDRIPWHCCFESQPPHRLSVSCQFGQDLQSNGTVCVYETSDNMESIRLLHSHSIAQPLCAIWL